MGACEELGCVFLGLNRNVLSGAKTYGKIHAYILYDVKDKFRRQLFN